MSDLDDKDFAVRAPYIQKILELEAKLTTEYERGKADGWGNTMLNAVEYIDSQSATIAELTKQLAERDAVIKKAMEQNALQIDLDKVVSNFLGWKLPKGFSPDAGISFTPRYNIGTPYERDHEPVGTNLFDAEQAKEMFIHCLSNSVYDATAYVAVPIPTLPGAG